MKRLIGCEGFETVFRKLLQSFLYRLECSCGIVYRVFKFYPWNCVRDLYHLFIWVAAAKRTSKCCFGWNTSFGNWKYWIFSFMATFPGCVNIFVQLYHFSRSNLLYLNFPCVQYIFGSFYWFLFSLSFVKISRASAKSIFFFSNFYFSCFSAMSCVSSFFLASTVSREQSFVRSFRDK